MNYRQYDIWLADLSPRFGTETGKTRPVIIVQNNLLNNIHPSTVICPLTSNVKPNSKILRVNLDAIDNGLKIDSAVMIDQIRAIDNKRLIKKIGTIKSQYIRHLQDNLKIILDL